MKLYKDIFNEVWRHGGKKVECDIIAGSVSRIYTSSVVGPLFKFGIGKILITKFQNSYLFLLIIIFLQNLFFFCLLFEVQFDCNNLYITNNEWRGTVYKSDVESMASSDVFQSCLSCKYY